MLFQSFAPALLAATPTINIAGSGSRSGSGAVAPRTTTMLVEFFSLSDASPETPPCKHTSATDTVDAAMAKVGDEADEAEEDVGLLTGPEPKCYNMDVSHSDWSNNTFIGAFRRHLYINDHFYQDRLGTNIGERAELG
jgi:hypothetical protein